MEWPICDLTRSHHRVLLLFLRCRNWRVIRRSSITVTTNIPMIARITAAPTVFHNPFEKSTNSTSLGESVQRSRDFPRHSGGGKIVKVGLEADFGYLLICGDVKACILWADPVLGARLN